MDDPIRVRLVVEREGWVLRPGDRGTVVREGHRSVVVQWDRLTRPLSMNREEIEVIRGN